jgi:predicted DCC family thiol-disulfide oxidoreductase YuxK
MNEGEALKTQTVSTPVLLFDDECGVCRRIASWVKKAAQSKSGQKSVIVRPIGADLEAIHALNPRLDIWEAYSVIHILMPDGSMKVGGEAVAEVFRRLPGTKWLAGCFNIGVPGFRPFQAVLNVGYAVLSKSRPLFGCESCGTSSFWARPIDWITRWINSNLRHPKNPSATRHFTKHARRALGPKSALVGQLPKA